MGKLSKLILAAREAQVTVGEWVFTIRRPDAMRSMSMAGMDGNALAELILRECVVDWKNVLERDLIGSGGSDQAVPFDSDDFVVWSRDRPEIWSPVVDAVVGAMQEWSSRVAESRKN